MLRPLLGLCAVIAFAVLPLVPERAERATFLPLVALVAVLLARPPERKLALRIARMALVAALAAVGAHVLLARAIGGRIIPGEIVFTALVFGSMMAVLSAVDAGLRAVARRVFPRSKAGVALLAAPLFVAFAVPYGFLEVATHRPKIGNGRDPSARRGIAFEDLAFRSADGETELRAWWIPAPSPRPSPRRERESSAVVLVHGVGANRGNFLELSWLYAKLGHAVLALDLRGHGDSQGHTVTNGLREAADVRAAVRVAALRLGPGGGNGRVALAGYSLGAATALLAAAEEPDLVAAVVSDSAFADLETIAVEQRRLGLLPEAGGRAFAFLALEIGRFATGIDGRAIRPIDALPRIAPRPILFIHGEADSVIPVEHTRRLHAAAPGPKELLLVPGAEHVGAYFEDPAAYEDRVGRFLDAALMETPPAR